ncbi:hypothetical protein [Mitsuaria sp. 7]|uniref:hypothetical protein n=1 Tax=Mitsuaria sp. 7 TaxID=1658665 RepID=UPI0012F712BF|nr:hypothetical protein [Mitsuaria sp. 7]
MSLQVNYIRPVSRTDRLVAIMVMPVPTAEGMSELTAVVELLRYPAVLFGVARPEGTVDARCQYTSWDRVDNALSLLERRNVSVTYVRHLLHLAAHFAQRHGLRREGTVTLTLFEHEGITSIRYEVPVGVSRDAALEWTSEFWGELAYVDLLQPNFLLSFVAEASA